MDDATPIQWRRRGYEQQDQIDQPPVVRIPHSEELHRGDKSLVGNKGYRRFLKIEGDGHFAVDEEQIKAEARYDALWVLRTNPITSLRP